MSSQVHIRRQRVWFGLDNSADDSFVDWQEGLRLRDVVPVEMRSTDRLRAYVNNFLESDLDRTLDPGDHVNLSLLPSGPGIAAFAAAHPFIANLALAFTLNVALHFLIPRPRGPKRRGDEESPSQSWSGVQNVRVEGQPKQVVYGEYRAVPQVLDEFIVNRNIPAESDYYALLSIGEGPVYSIAGVTEDTPLDEPFTSEAGNIPAGIQVNGNELQNFDGVEVHIRMGTNDQLPIRGFEYVNTPYDVGSVLDQVVSASGDTTQLAISTYNSNAAGDQAVWDQYGFGFDMTDDADAYSITITFQNGLYKIGSSGNLQDAAFQPLMRYIELDGGGIPIASGGDNGDGYVYVPPEPMLFAHHQSTFNYELTGLFRDPQSYVPGTAGNCLSCDGINDYGATSATPLVPPSWAPGSQPDAVTWCGWVSFTSLPAGTTVAHQPIIEWGNTGTNGGWCFGISRRQFDSGGPSSAWYWVPTVYYRTTGTTSVTVIHEGTGAFPPAIPSFPVVSVNTYYFLSFAYRKATPGVNGHFSIHLNGQLVKYVSFSSSSPNIGGITAARPFEVFRSTGLVKQLNAGADTYTSAKGDEFVIFNRELILQEIQGRYNGGIGVSGSSGGDIVAAWHFDNTSAVSTPDYGPNGNTLNLNNGANTTTGGIVVTSTPAAVKRSTYRVEVLRRNKTSDSTAIQDEATWSVLTGKVDEWLSYPNTALLAIKIKATDQLNSTAPVVTVLTKGRLVPVWDGVSLTSPNITNQWSQNPAWIALDVITNNRYGLGTYFSFSTGTFLEQFYDLATYADGFVYDGMGQKQTIHESNATYPIIQITYDGTMFSGFGGFRLVFRAAAGHFPPNYWVVGRFLGFTGLPTDGTVVVDINIGGGLQDGWEIGAVTIGAGTAFVDLRYDKATYGDPPWGGGGDYGTSATTTLTGEVQGMERRYQYDHQHDTFNSGWNTLIDILSTCRAMPTKEGNKIGVRYERPRQAVAVVNHASIKPGSFEIEYPGRLDRPNSYSADFFDRDNNYERSSASQDDPELETAALEEDIHRENLTLTGVVRRSQLIRHLLWMLKINRLSDRIVKFASGLEACSTQVGDVVQLSHDIVPYGKSGRIPDNTATTTSVPLDRDVVLAPATSYFLRVCDASAGQELNSDNTASDVYRTTAVTSAAGSYPLGTPLTVTALPFTPAKDDKYVLFKSGEELLVNIAETKLAPDMSVQATAVRYNEDAYDVDTLPEDLPATAASGGANPMRMPLAVQGIRVIEITKPTSDGSFDTELAVSWTHDEETQSIVSDSYVYARTDGDYEYVASGYSRASFKPRVSEPGTIVEIAVQARSVGGAALSARRSPTAKLILQGVWQTPQPPSDFAVHMDGDQAIHEWTAQTNNRGLSNEVRRGGWILGQSAGIAPPGATTLGPTRNWAGPSFLLLRSRDARGQYSSAVRVDEFDPSVSGAQVLAYPTVTEQDFHADNEWSDEWAPGEPWYDDGDLDSPTHAGLEREQLADGAWVLKFAGSNLTGTYQVSVGAVPSEPPFGLPEEAYVELLVEGDQIAPFTMADWLLPVNDPRVQRRTFEGPITLTRGEPRNCELKIEIQWTNPDTDVRGAWQTYAPGIYYMSSARYRFTVTRPSTDYQVRIRRFYSRVSRVARKVFERNDVSGGLARSLLRIG